VIFDEWGSGTPDVRARPKWGTSAGLATAGRRHCIGSVDPYYRTTKAPPLGYLPESVDPAGPTGRFIHNVGPVLAQQVRTDDETSSMSLRRPRSALADFTAQRAGPAQLEDPPTHPAECSDIRHRRRWSPRPVGDPSEAHEESTPTDRRSRRSRSSRARRADPARRARTSYVRKPRRDLRRVRDGGSRDRRQERARSRGSAARIRSGQPMSRTRYEQGLRGYVISHIATAWS